ncbi:membrane-bound immunoglobulin [Labeo rohita]|nr:membrane-bound immunoglobulin [Labeo rohita]
MKQVYRVPFECNSERVKELRYNYVQRVLELEVAAVEHQFIFIDEVGFNLTKRRRQGRNVIGQRAIVEVPGQRGGNIAMCAAITNHGVIHHHATLGPYNTAHLITFLEILHNTLIPPDQIDGPEQLRYVVIWDNVELKHDKQCSFCEAISSLSWASNCSRANRTFKRASTWDVSDVSADSDKGSNFGIDNDDLTSQAFSGVTGATGDSIATDDSPCSTSTSDNNPLAHLNTANLGAVEQRWAAQLAGFQFEVRYRPGRTNGNADALSRWPVSESSAGPTEDGAVPCGGVGYVASEVVRACVHAFVPVTENVEEGHKFETVVHTNQGDQVGPSLLVEWKRAQRTDPAVSRLWVYMDRGRGPTPRERAAEDRSTQVLLRQWARLCVDQGLLCREVCDSKTFDKLKQIVVPQCLQMQVLEWVHDHAGHLGAEKTLSLARRRFFWPRLAQGVEKWCLQCVRCNLHKTPANKHTFNEKSNLSANHIALEGSWRKAGCRDDFTEKKGTSHCVDYFDYWGKGTKVTVSSAQQSAPKSIFPMSQCTSDSDGFLTIGCLARGFSPADSVTFKWKNHADKVLSDFVQYPAFGREGDYAKISHMRVRKSEWDPQKPYKCEASNSKGTIYSRVAPAPIRVNKPTIALLSRKDGDRMVLECQLNDYFPDKLTVQWLEDDRSTRGQIDKKFQNTDKGEKNYTYISQLPISAPYEDKKYTCKATFNSEEIKKEYNMCEAPDNTKVSWLTDNVRKTATKEVKDPSNNIVSNLTLSKNEWLTLKTVVCIAKHPCFPEQRNEIPNGYIKKDPVVVIRRTLMKSAQADSAVLECVVNDLPSGDATIELSVISSVGQSSSDSQKLLCSVTGFDPKIKWLSQSREKTGRALDVTVMEDGRVKVYSEILVPRQDWTQGVSYTCQTTTSGKTVEKSTSVCTVQSLFKPSVQIKRAHLRDIIQESKVTVSCVVEAPDNTKVSWLTDSVSKPATKEVKDPSNNIVSTLTLTRSEWLTLKTVVCIAKHPCFSEQRDEIPAGYIKKDPVVMIRRTLMKSAQADSAELECVVNDLPSAPPPDLRASVYLTVPSKMELENGTATFMCVAQRFSPKTYAFKWFQDGRDVTNAIEKFDKSEKNGSETEYSATSILQISAEEWQPNSKMKCQFEHKAGNQEKEVEYTDCDESGSDIDQDIVPPSPEDMLKNRVGLLKCKASAENAGFVKITIKANNNIIANNSGDKYFQDRKTVELDAPIGYEEWSNGTEFTCTIEHRELAEPKEKTFSRENGKEPKKPTVFIIAPPEHKPGEPVTLTCYVKDFYPKEVFVSWLVDDEPLPAKYNYSTSQPIKNGQNFSAYSQLTVDYYEWKNAIRVNKPTLALLSRKDGDRIVLECQLNDYFPDKLNVQWLEGDKSVKGQIDKKFQNTDKGEKNYTYISQLPISAPYEDKKYTCKATFNSEEIKKEYNMCKAQSLFKPSIQIKRSHLRDIIQQSKVTISCVVEAPDNTKVSWLKDNENKTATREVKDPSYNIVSNMTLSKDEWLTLKTIVCIAKHPCFPEVRNEIPAGYMKKDPIVVIRRTLMKSAQADSAVLECVVNDLPSADATIELSVVPSVGQSSSDSQKLLCSVMGFDPKIKWLSQSIEKTGSASDVTVMEDGRGKVYSEILVPRQEWNQGVTYTCQTTSKHSGKTVEKSTSVCTGYIKKDPVVVIRRTLMKSAQADSAVLECVVNGLPSGDATIELAVVPSVGQSSSDSQKLLCSVTGFDPKIKWLSQSIEKTGSASDVTVMEDGRVKVYSEILVPRQEWNQGVTYTCQATSRHSGKTVEKSTSVCTGYMKKDPVVVIRRTLMKSAQADSAVLECVVNDLPSGDATIELSVVPSVGQSSSDSQKLLCSVTGFNPKIKWLSQSIEKTGSASDVTVMEDGRGKVYSEILVPRQEWNQGVTYTCQTTSKHSGKTVEKSTSVCTGYIKKDPVVVIRRTLMKSAQADSAVLECVVNDLPSGDATIELAVVPSVGQSSSDSQKLLCSVTGFDPKIKWLSQSIEKTGSASDVTVMEDGRVKVYSEILVPRQEWNQGVTYTCQATSRHSGKTVEKSTSVCTGDATIELAVVPSVGQSSSDSQKLLCSVTGFDPKIKWLSQSREKTGSASDVTVMEDGRVKAFSEILVPRQEWNQGVTYTCQTKTAEKNASICTVIAPYSQQAGVYLLGPSLRNVRSATNVNLTCLVVGQSVKLFSIQWKVNGVLHNGYRQDPKDHNNGTESTEHILRVSVEEWNTYAVFTCEVKHLCSNDGPQKKTISKIRDPIQPTVAILSPSDSVLSGLQNASLLCLITGFFPSDITVQWQLNGTELDVSHFSNSPVVNDTSGGFAIYSALMLPASERKDSVFSCVVSHESSQNPIIATIENLYASVIETAPSAMLLQGATELVCLVFGFSPPAINITWLRGTTEVFAHRVSNPAKGPDGKFSVQSYLDFQPSDWAPGEVYTCKVTHVADNVSRSISKTALFEEAIFMNENKPEAIAQDTVEETWNMACAFLALFLFSLIYGCTVTLVKVKRT